MKMQPEDNYYNCLREESIKRVQCGLTERLFLPIIVRVAPGNSGGMQVVGKSNDMEICEFLKPQVCVLLAFESSP